MQRAVLYGLFVMGLVAACGGREPDETEPEYPFPAESDFCEALAVSECSASVVKACYGSDDTTLGEDQPSCVSARGARCNPAGLPYHPERAESCVETRKEALLDAVWTQAELDAAELACLPVFSKEGPDGAVCTSIVDCDSATGLRCIVKLGDIQGVCGTPVMVAGGEDCTDPVTVCRDGFYCDTAVSHCLAARKEDETCSASSPCAADFYCTSPEDGVCVLKTKNGLDCMKDEVCAGGFCVGASEKVTGKCSATLPLQINAEGCDLYR